MQALGVDYDLRNALYAKLVRLSFGYFDRHQTGQLMSRATVDIQSVRFFLGYGLIFFFQHVFTVVGVDDPRLPRSRGSSRWSRSSSRRSSSRSPTTTRNVSHPVLRDVQQKMADVATVAEENVVGVHVVKSFAQEQAEQDKFERRSEALFDQSVTREPAARVLRAAARLPAAARRRRRCSSPAGTWSSNGSLSVGDVRRRSTSTSRC